MSPSFHGDHPPADLGHGGALLHRVAPASRASPTMVGVTLGLEAVVGVLHGVPVAALVLFGAQARAQALCGESPLVNIRQVYMYKDRPELFNCTDAIL